MRWLRRWFRSADRDVEPPISDSDLRALFEFVGAKTGCDNHLTHATAFLRDHGLPVKRTLVWLQNHGGYCDCEVVMNVYDRWGNRVDWCLDTDVDLEDDEF